MVHLQYAFLAVALQVLHVLSAPTAAADHHQPQCSRLPPPTGKYKVGIQTLPLTDASRAETHGPGRRTVLVSLYFPAARSNDAPTSAYMPAVMEQSIEQAYGLPAGILSRVCTNSHITPPATLHSDFTGNGAGIDVLLFSPGLGVTRLEYTSLLEDLASHGHLVVAVDHPYDTDVLEFPDGHVVRSAVPTNYTTPEEVVVAITPFYDVRVADMAFVTRALPGLALLRRSAVKQVGIFGHSLGGATAAGTMLVFPAYAAGANLDGQFFGAAAAGGPSADIKRPFLLMNAAVHNSTTDSTWAAFRAAQTGGITELHLNGSAHGTYSDLPVLADLLGLRAVLPPDQVTAGIGDIPGFRAELIIRTYVRAFFEGAFAAKKDPLLVGPSKSFPEITFI